ncbi:MAG TPA: cytochrome P460 family protein [Chitinophaga sp.]|uniref:cytochrome P460 family protein n=1 Tax=Chitinophaga sp. TaxID=1869181 RepID=UPI002F95BE26
MKYTYILLAALFMVSCSSKMEDAGTLNKTASLPAAFNFNKQGWKVITSFINRQQATMSTLYGNEAAFKYATTGASGSYPPGAALALVTWKQQEDKRWYGASIPAELQTLELVTNSSDAIATYQQYKGAALSPAPPADSLQENTRIRYILGQKASVLP